MIQPNQYEDKELRKLFDDYNISLHLCGTADCENSRQTVLFLGTLNHFIKNRITEARLDELELASNVVDHDARWNLHELTRTVALKGLPNGQ